MLRKRNLTPVILGGSCISLMSESTPGALPNILYILFRQRAASHLYF